MNNNLIISNIDKRMQPNNPSFKGNLTFIFKIASIDKMDSCYFTCKPYLDYDLKFMYFSNTLSMSRKFKVKKRR